MSSSFEFEFWSLLTSPRIIASILAWVFSTLKPKAAWCQTTQALIGLYGCAMVFIPNSGTMYYQPPSDRIVLVVANIAKQWFELFLSLVVHTRCFLGTYPLSESIAIHKTHTTRHVTRHVPLRRWFLHRTNVTFPMDFCIEKRPINERRHPKSSNIHKSVHTHKCVQCKH